MAASPAFEGLSALGLTARTEAGGGSISLGFLLGTRTEAWGRFGPCLSSLGSFLFDVHKWFQCPSFSMSFRCLAFGQAIILLIGTDVHNFPLFFRLLVFD